MDEMATVMVMERCGGKVCLPRAESLHRTIPILAIFLYVR